MDSSSSGTYMESSTVRQETTTTVGVIDKSYIRGIPGIFKMVEMLGLLIAFICVIASLSCAGHVATFDFFKGISILLCITTLILYLFLLFQLQIRLLRADCCRAYWPLFELGYHIIVVIFLFFADLFLSLHGCLPGHKAGAFFGWLAFSAFVADTIIALYYFCKSSRSSSSTTTMTTKTTTTSSTAQPHDARY